MANVNAVEDVLTSAGLRDRLGIRRGRVLDFLGDSQIAEPYLWYGESGTANCFCRGAGADRWVRIDRGLSGMSFIDTVDRDIARSWASSVADDWKVVVDSDCWNTR